MAWLVAAMAERDRSEHWLDWPFAAAGGWNGGPPYPRIWAPAGNSPKRFRPAGHVILELDGRPRPDGIIEMCHAPTCPSPMCLNPSDLRWDSRSENNRDIGRSDHPRTVFPRGEDYDRSDLTEDDVREIRRLNAAGISKAALGRRYNVTRTAIYLIVVRKNWAHVV